MVATGNGRGVLELNRTGPIIINTEEFTAQRGSGARPEPSRPVPSQPGSSPSVPVSRVYRHGDTWARTVETSAHFQDEKKRENLLEQYGATFTRSIGPGPNGERPVAEAKRGLVHIGDDGKLVYIMNDKSGRTVAMDFTAERNDLKGNDHLKGFYEADFSRDVYDQLTEFYHRARAANPNGADITKGFVKDMSVDRGPLLRDHQYKLHIIDANGDGRIGPGDVRIVTKEYIDLVKNAKNGGADFLAQAAAQTPAELRSKDTTLKQAVSDQMLSRLGITQAQADAVAPAVATARAPAGATGVIKPPAPPLPAAAPRPDPENQPTIRIEEPTPIVSKPLDETGAGGAQSGGGEGGGTGEGAVESAVDDATADQTDQPFILKTFLQDLLEDKRRAEKQSNPNLTDEDLSKIRLTAQDVANALAALVTDPNTPAHTQMVAQKLMEHYNKLYNWTPDQNVELSDDIVELVQKGNDSFVPPDAPVEVLAGQPNAPQAGGTAGAQQAAAVPGSGSWTGLNWNDMSVAQRWMAIGAGVAVAYAAGRPIITPVVAPIMERIVQPRLMGSDLYKEYRDLRKQEAEFAAQEKALNKEIKQANGVVSDDLRQRLDKYFAETNDWKLKYEDWKVRRAEVKAGQPYRAPTDIDTLRNRAAGAETPAAAAAETTPAGDTIVVPPGRMDAPVVTDEVSVRNRAHDYSEMPGRRDQGQAVDVENWLAAENEQRLRQQLMNSGVSADQIDTMINDREWRVGQNNTEQGRFGNRTQAVAELLAERSVTPPTPTTPVPPTTPDGGTPVTATPEATVDATPVAAAAAAADPDVMRPAETAAAATPAAAPVETPVQATDRLLRETALEQERLGRMMDAARNAQRAIPEGPGKYEANQRIQKDINDIVQASRAMEATQVELRQQRERQLMEERAAASAAKPATDVDLSNPSAWNGPTPEFIERHMKPMFDDIEQRRAETQAAADKVQADLDHLSEQRKALGMGNENRAARTALDAQAEPLRSQRNDHNAKLAEIYQERVALEETRRQIYRQAIDERMQQARNTTGAEHAVHQRAVQELHERIRGFESEDRARAADAGDGTRRVRSTEHEKPSTPSRYNEAEILAAREARRLEGLAVQEASIVIAREGDALDVEERRLAKEFDALDDRRRGLNAEREALESRGQALEAERASYGENADGEQFADFERRQALHVEETTALAAKKAAYDAERAIHDAADAAHDTALEGHQQKLNEHKARAAKHSADVAKHGGPRTSAVGVNAVGVDADTIRPQRQGNVLFNEAQMTIRGGHAPTVSGATNAMTIGSLALKLDDVPAPVTSDLRLNTPDAVAPKGPARILDGEGRFGARPVSGQPSTGTAEVTLHPSVPVEIQTTPAQRASLLGERLGSGGANAAMGAYQIYTGVQGLENAYQRGDNVGMTFYGLNTAAGVTGLYTGAKTMMGGQVGKVAGTLGSASVGYLLIAGQAGYEVYAEEGEWRITDADGRLSNKGERGVAAVATGAAAVGAAIATGGGTGVVAAGSAAAAGGGGALAVGGAAAVAAAPVVVAGAGVAAVAVTGHEFVKTHRTFRDHDRDLDRIRSGTGVMSQLSTEAKANGPKFQHYQGLVSSLGEVSRFMRDEHMNLPQGGIKREGATGQFSVETQKNVDFNDPKNVREYERALNVYIQQQTQKRDENSSFLPSWARYGSQSSQKYEDARTALAFAEASRTSLQAYKADVEKYNAGKSPQPVERARTTAPTATPGALSVRFRNEAALTGEVKAAVMRGDREDERIYTRDELIGRNKGEKDRVTVAESADKSLFMVANKTGNGYELKIYKNNGDGTYTIVNDGYKNQAGNEKNAVTHTWTSEDGQRYKFRAELAGGSTILTIGKFNGYHNAGLPGHDGQGFQRVGMNSERVGEFNQVAHSTEIATPENVSNPVRPTNPMMVK